MVASNVKPLDECQTVNMKESWLSALSVCVSQICSLQQGLSLLSAFVGVNCTYTLALRSMCTLSASENLKGYGCLSYSDISDYIQNLILLNQQGGRQTIFKELNKHTYRNSDCSGMLLK